MKSLHSQFNDADMLIYYNYWKYIALLLIAVVFTVGIIPFLIRDEYRPDYKILLYLSEIVMGAASLYLLFDLVYRMVSRIPVIAIYPDRVVSIASFKKRVYITYFRDVDHFSIFKMNSAKFIAVNYKKQALENKRQEASAAKNWLYSFNYSYCGAIESISTSTLTIKGDKLCDILNIYLQEFNKNNIQTSATPPAFDK